MRQLAWIVLLLVAAYLSADFLLAVYGKYHGPDPGNFAMFVGREHWLFAHLAGGAMTILLGLLQLLPQRVRPVRPIHRWTGRLYLLGMVIGCSGAVGLISTSPAPAGIRIAFAVTMLMWISTASVAFIAIRRKQIAVHRTWMLRNYVVTLAPVTFRLLLPLAVAVGITPSPTLIATLLWVSWSLPLLALEAFMRTPRLALAEA